MSTSQRGTIDSMIPNFVGTGGVRAAADREKMYGDAYEHQQRVVIGYNAVLEAAGIFGGGVKKLDTHMVLALQMQEIVMGMIKPGDAPAILMDHVAKSIHAARALGLQEVKAAEEGEHKEPESKAPQHGVAAISGHAQRQVPRRTED